MNKAKLNKLANEALDAMEIVRDKISIIGGDLEDTEGNQSCVDALTVINESATKLVNAYNALENIFAAVEDITE